MLSLLFALIPTGFLSNHVYPPTAQRHGHSRASARSDDLRQLPTWYVLHSTHSSCAQSLATMPCVTADGFNPSLITSRPFPQLHHSLPHRLIFPFKSGAPPSPVSRLSGQESRGRSSTEPSQSCVSLVSLHLDVIVYRAPTSDQRSRHDGKLVLIITLDLIFLPCSQLKSLYVLSRFKLRISSRTSPLMVLVTLLLVCPIQDDTGRPHTYVALRAVSLLVYTKKLTSLYHHFTCL